MEFVELKAGLRTQTGKGYARTLRREGQIPGILYGPDTAPVMLSLDYRDLEQMFKTGSVGQMLINLAVENSGGELKPTMIKELQIDPLTRNFLHVDFYEISLDRKLSVRIPVTVKGTPKGVENDGLLQIIRYELEVYCYPREIPETIELDVTDLDIGDAIHVSEISLPGDVEIPYDVDFTVVTVVAPKFEELPEEGEEVELEEGEGEEGEAGEGEGASESESEE